MADNRIVYCFQLCCSRQYSVHYSTGLGSVPLNYLMELLLRKVALCSLSRDVSNYSRCHCHHCDHYGLSSTNAGKYLNAPIYVIGALLLHRYIQALLATASSECQTIKLACCATPHKATPAVPCSGHLHSVRQLAHHRKLSCSFALPSCTTESIDPQTFA